MPRKLNEMALKLAALASQLERSNYIEELWPDAFKHGRVKVMVSRGYYNGIKRVWLQDSKGRQTPLTMAQYERLKL